MATSSSNVLTRGYSGKFAGQMIFRNYGGISVMSKVHDYRRKVWSKAQEDGRRRFRLAVRWAKVQLMDEKKLRYYRKRAKGTQTATNVAIADYMKNLRLSGVDCNNYHGTAGDIIRMTLKKQYGASRVRVYILGPRGVTIETGEAGTTDNGTTWNYRTGPRDPLIRPESITVELIRGPVTFSEEWRLPKDFQ